MNFGHNQEYVKEWKPICLTDGGQIFISGGHRWGTSYDIRVFAPYCHGCVTQSPKPIYLVEFDRSVVLFCLLF